MTSCILAIVQPGGLGTTHQSTVKTKLYLDSVGRLHNSGESWGRLSLLRDRNYSLGLVISPGLQGKAAATG